MMWTYGCILKVLRNNEISRQGPSKKQMVYVEGNLKKKFNEGAIFKVEDEVKGFQMNEKPP